MKEKIEFPTNVPIEISLAFETGKPITTQYGDSVMFTTTDDRVFFGPPILQERISNLGVQRGEAFLITRAEKKMGQRRTTEWQVGRPREEEPQQVQPIKVAPAAALVEAPFNSTPVNGIAAGDLERKLRESIELAKNNGTDPQMLGPGLQMLELSICAAIDGCQKGEAYAKDQNYPIRFTSEDVRAIALTLYIQGAKDRAQKWAH